MEFCDGSSKPYLVLVQISAWKFKLTPKMIHSQSKVIYPTKQFLMNVNKFPIGLCLYNGGTHTLELLLRIN